MYILVATQTMAGDPGYRYEIQDMDQTGGFIRVPAGNNDLELRSRILDNDQAREIRKAIEAGLTGSELEDVILAVRGPDQTPAPAIDPAALGIPPVDPSLANLQNTISGGSTPTTPDTGPAVEPPPAPAPMEPSPEEGNPAPPAGFDAADAPTGA